MKITIKYQSTHSKPEGCNHICTDDEITGESSQVFDNYEDAIDFWFECSFPVTNIQEIPIPGVDPKVSEQINATLKLREKARSEELLTSQKPLYVFSEDDSTESYLPGYKPTTFDDDIILNSEDNEEL